MSLITPDFGLLVWMVLIFGIVFFILAKFGFPMITGMVDKRAERINESIAKAKEAEDSLASLAEQQKKMLEEARAEQGRILKEAAEARDKIVSSAKQEAQDEAAKILEHAAVEIEARKEAALSDVRAQVAAVSLAVAEKILRSQISSDEGQKAFIDRLLDEAAEAAQATEASSQKKD